MESQARQSDMNWSRGGVSVTLTMRVVISPTKLEEFNLHSYEDVESWLDGESLGRILDSLPWGEPDWEVD